MTDTTTCPDCGRPYSGTDSGLLETHCFANRPHDWLGQRMCRDNAITRLHSDIAAKDLRIAELERAIEEMYPEHHLLEEERLG